jgi:hypothetical protein
MRLTSSWWLGILGAAALGGPVTTIAQVDFAGEWAQMVHEDLAERGGGPDFGDYTGLPINDAARFRASTWDQAKWSVPEHQCEPHPADYAPHGPASLRIWNAVAAWQKQIQVRGLFLGMAKPPGPHEGGSMVVVTSHLKPGYLQSNGLPYSDRARLTEYFTTFTLPNGQDWFVVTSIVDDPVCLGFRS